MATPSARGTADLGELVRQRRLELGLTQAELAADAQVGRQWLVGFEAGDKTSAPLDMVLRLLAELSLTVLLDPTAPRADRPLASADAPPVITASEILKSYEQPAPPW